MRSAHDEILARMAAVVSDRGPHVLHEPEFLGNEEHYVAECIRTGWVSTAGSFVGRFEEALARFTGARSVVAVNNGTAALHGCLLAIGVGAGDEVLAPALTFVATANAISHAGATPHFVEVDPRTLGVDPARLAEHLTRIAERRNGSCWNRSTGRRIAALVVMHCFGHPADLDALTRVCTEWHLDLVEDAAESLGSIYRGRHTGRFGRIAALSFNGNKVVTTGGGGAILCEDAALGDRIRHIVTTARVTDGWEFTHDAVGYNYRLPNINAALGMAQLERLPGMVEDKRRLAQRYIAAFAGCGAARVFEEPADSRSNYWLNTLILDERLRGERDNILSALHQAGFHCRPAWMPMHRLPMYRDCPRMDLRLTEDLHQRIVNLPSSPKLGRMAAQ